MEPCAFCREREGEYPARWFRDETHNRELASVFEEIGSGWLCSVCAKEFSGRFPPGECSCGKPAVLALSGRLLCAEHAKEWLHRTLALMGVEVLDDYLDYRCTDAAYYETGTEVLFLSRGGTEFSVTVEGEICWYSPEDGEWMRSPVPLHIPADAVEFDKNPWFTLYAEDGEGSPLLDIKQLPFVLGGRIGAEPPNPVRVLCSVLRDEASKKAAIALRLRGTLEILSGETLLELFVGADGRVSPLSQVSYSGKVMFLVEGESGPLARGLLEHLKDEGFLPAIPLGGDILVELPSSWPVSADVNGLWAPGAEVVMVEPKRNLRAAIYARFPDSLVVEGHAEGGLAELATIVHEWAGDSLAEVLCFESDAVRELQEWSRRRGVNISVSE